MKISTRGLTQVGPNEYEAPDWMGPHAIERDHGEKHVEHLTARTMHDRDDMLDWVCKFAQHRKAQGTVGGHIQAMQKLHKLSGSDLDAAQEYLAPVKGAQNMVTKAFIPEGVWATILHFDPKILREGRVDEILRARPEWCAPWYKPKGGKKWRLHSLLPRKQEVGSGSLR